MCLLIKPFVLRHFSHLKKVLVGLVGLDSVVGIETRYGLDGPGIESRWGRDFLHLFGPALGPTQLPIQWINER
jgi:hypothetical protein